jgi:hypothetical protein
LSRLIIELIKLLLLELFESKPLALLLLALSLLKLQLLLTLKLLAPAFFGFLLGP